MRIGAHTADAGSGSGSRLVPVRAAVVDGGMDAMRCLTSSPAMPVARRAAVAAVVAVAVAAVVARIGDHVLAVLRPGSARSCLFSGPGIGGPVGTAGAGLGSPSLEAAEGMGSLHCLRASRPMWATAGRARPSRAPSLTWS